MSDETVTKITKSTVLSLHVVTLLIGGIVWIVRLSDRVAVNERAIARLERFCYGRSHSNPKEIPDEY